MFFPSGIKPLHTDNVLLRKAAPKGFTPLEKKFCPFDMPKKYMARRGLKPQDLERHHTSFLTGFTLLELIIAIAILSMVTLIIGSGFRLGIKAWTKGETETQETQRLRALSGLMTQNVKSIYPYRMRIEGKNIIVFKGENNSIMFVTTFVDPSVGGFKWVRYSINDGALLLKEGILPDKKFLEKISGNEEVIDTDIEKLEFKYLSTDKSEWKESWDLGEGLPAAVKIKIAYFQPFFITIPMGLGNSPGKIGEINEFSFE